MTKKYEIKKKNEIKMSVAYIGYVLILAANTLPTIHRVLAESTCTICTRNIH